MVPIFDGRLPDGSRVNGTIPPVSPDGPTLTIRKFREDPLTMIDLIKFGTVNLRLAAMMWVWIEGLDSRPAISLLQVEQGLENHDTQLSWNVHSLAQAPSNRRRYLNCRFITTTG